MNTSKLNSRLAEWETERKHAIGVLDRRAEGYYTELDAATVLTWRRWGASWGQIDYALDITAIKFESTPSYRWSRLPDPMAYATGVLRNVLRDTEGAHNE